MNMNFKKEEYSAMGDFIMPIFIRDKDAIRARFPRLDDAFLGAFTAKLNFVKELESGLVITEAQKNTTRSMYVEAEKLNGELNFLSSYFKDAGLNTAIVTDLKTNLTSHNIEGAVLKIEAIRQYVVINSTVLVDHGMEPHFQDVLLDYKTSLAAKNASQNDFMREHRELTSRNAAHYEELYGFISKICSKGKLVFKNTVFQNEYTISKNLAKMRVAKRNSPTVNKDKNNDKGGTPS